MLEAQEYAKLMLPPTDNGSSVEVTVFLEVLHISDPDEKTQSFSSQLIMGTSWSELEQQISHIFLVLIFLLGKYWISFAGLTKDFTLHIMQIKVQMIV